MYKSPITISTFRDIQSEVSKAFDDKVVATVRATVGIDVDKDELIKALKYDREEYEYGYRDGARGIYPRPRCGEWNNKGNWWSEGITDFEIWQCSYCGESVSTPVPTKGDYELKCKYKYCPNCGARMDGGT